MLPQCFKQQRRLFLVTIHYTKSHLLSGTQSQTFLSFHGELRENFHSKFSPTKSTKSTVLPKSQCWNQQHTSSFYSEVKCDLWNVWQLKLNSSIQLCLNFPQTKALSSLSLHTVSTCLGLMPSPPLPLLSVELQPDPLRPAMAGFPLMHGTVIGSYPQANTAMAIPQGNQTIKPKSQYYLKWTNILKKWTKRKLCLWAKGIAISWRTTGKHWRFRNLPTSFLKYLNILKYD